MRVLLVSANRERLPSPVVPLGVLSVASAAREAGHDVTVEDLCFAEDPDAALRAAIARVSPDVVGLGLRNLRDNAYGGAEAIVAYYASLTRAVREETRAPLVLGGAATSLRPTQLLDRLGADHAIAGEGERAFPELLGALARGERPPRITRAKGAPLDELARPARELVDPRYYALEGTTSVQTKRGCAFHCAYCDYPDLEGRSVRVRSPDAVAADFEACARDPSISHVFVVDSVFNAPRSHARAVCDALVARDVRVPWVCYASPAGLDDDLVAAMARAGCVGAEIGTDAGSDDGLARLRKPFDVAQVRRVRASFRAHGVADCHSFVLGAEGETVDDARRTLDFVADVDPDVAVFLVFAEDREDRLGAHTEHRAALLELLAREAPRHAGWVVPELGVRFGAKVTRVMQRRGLRGPSWLHLANARRAARVGVAGA